MSLHWDALRREESDSLMPDKDAVGVPPNEKRLKTSGETVAPQPPHQQTLRVSQRRCLVICPATLVGHWCSEARAFLQPSVLAETGNGNARCAINPLGLEGYSKAERGRRLQIALRTDEVGTSGGGQNETDAILDDLFCDDLSGDAGVRAAAPRSLAPPAATLAAEEDSTVDQLFVVVSYSTLRSDVDLLASVGWDVLVLDEAHTMSNTTSQVTAS